ncbi:arginine repressor [Candidatus Latescibacterota bacterium]
MSGKRRRQAAIGELLIGSRGSTQEQIKDELERRGIHASQSTLSRDLREMGAVKVHVEEGAVYMIGESFNPDEVGSAMRAFVTGSEAVGNFLVIRTSPGNASGFSVVLDRLGWPEIVGTIAGDDTILVIGRTAEDINTIEQHLNESIGRDIQ